MLMQNSQNGRPTRWWASSAEQPRGMWLSAPILLPAIPAVKDKDSAPHSLVSVLSDPLRLAGRVSLVGHSGNW